MQTSYDASQVNNIAPQAVVEAIRKQWFASLRAGSEVAK